MKLHLKDGSVLKYKPGMPLTGLNIASIELDYEDGNVIPEEIIFPWAGEMTKPYALEEKLRMIEVLSETIQRNEPAAYEHAELAAQKLKAIIASL